MAKMILWLVMQDDGRWVRFVSDMYGLAELGLLNFTGFTHGRHSLLLIDYRHALWNKLIRSKEPRAPFRS